MSDKGFISRVYFFLKTTQNQTVKKKTKPVLVSSCYYNKLPQICGLKQHKFIILKFWKLEV